MIHFLLLVIPPAGPFVVTRSITNSNQGAACSIKGRTQEDNRSKIDVEVADEEDEAGGGDKGKGKKRGKDKD
jgi:hypothetical protein